MKISFYVFIIFAFTSAAFASDDADLQDAPLTPDSVRSAFADAEKEFQAINVAKPPDSLPAQSPKDLNTLVSKLTKATKVENGTLLEDLAKQVDTLRNKVVVERTTMLATQSPRRVRVNGAKTVFNFKDTAIYEVTSAVDHVTDIQLKPGESITTAPTSGDTVRWNIGVMKSGLAPELVTHIIIKPLDDEIETNLVITTDEHVYQLRLKSGEFHMPVVSWNYPEDFEEAMQNAIKREDSQEVTTSPELLRFTYDIDGDDYSWRPLRVFDDGKKTFIQMPQNMRVSDAPVFFILEEGSDPMLVNYRVKGDYYIVDRLFERAELRVGPKRKIEISLDSGRNWFQRVFF